MSSSEEDIIFSLDTDIENTSSSDEEENMAPSDFVKVKMNDKQKHGFRYNLKEYGRKVGNRWKCLQCQKKYLQSQSLRQHARSIHMLDI